MKLVVVGDAAVGKTCMLISYTSNSFPTNYIPTVFDNYSSGCGIGDTHQLGGKTFRLSLWDTAGQEDYDRLRPLSYPQTDVVLIVYSVIDPRSFSNAYGKWTHEINMYLPGVHRLLVGSKIDLRDDLKTLKLLDSQGLRPLTYEDGLEMASKVHVAKYVECSALTAVGLKEVFDEAIRVVLFPKGTPTPERSPSCLIL
uniref:Uncharacterized protein n=1 Tax=Arcella intermedia TaxID=1963864 RepID=A0A6B2LK50_9EUKA